MAVNSVSELIVWTMAAITAVAAATDMHSRVIPNWLCATGVALGFGLNLWLGGLPGLWTAFLGFALALALYVPLWLLRAMGGGDVKLMAAIGALAGPTSWFTIFVLASVLGGVFAFILLFARNAMGRSFQNIWHILTNLARLRAPYATRPELDIAHEKAISLPHGVAIAAGTFVFLFVR